MSARISIAMCTYNGESYLEQQLESLASQDRRPDELVICDDCSSDRSVAIIQKWAPNAPFPVHLQVNADRLGSTRNFAEAIARCQGDLISLCDQDDVWLSHKLLEAEQAFLDEPELGFWFTNALLVDEQLKPTGGTLWESYRFGPAAQHKLNETGIAILLRTRFVTGATMVFNARQKPLVLPIPTGFSTMIHDGWIATLVAAVAKIGFSAKPSMLYRLHPRQQIGARVKQTIIESMVERFERHGLALAEDLAIVQAVKSRLLEAPPGSVPTLAAQHVVDERLRLLLTRTSLPPQRLRRLRPIAMALAMGQYHRHATGVTSALKDLVI